VWGDIGSALRGWICNACFDTTGYMVSGRISQESGENTTLVRDGVGGRMIDASRYIVAWFWLALMVVSVFAVETPGQGCISMIAVMTGVIMVLWVSATIKTRNLGK
jgi:hypothetical protein